MRKLYVYILLISFSYLGFPQAVPQLKEQARENFELERYLDAIEFYEKIVGLDKNDVEARFNLAFCYFKTFQFDKAARQYLDLIQNKDRELSGEALYYYGTILKLNSEYELADSVFSYLIQNFEINEYILEQARKQREGCQIATNISIQNRGFSIEEMDINSRYHDFGAVINRADNSLTYVTTQNVSSRQYASAQFSGLLPELVRLRRKGNRWQNATSQDKFDRVNSEWAEGSGSYTADGNYFYFTSCRNNEGADCKIMVSKFEDGQWTEPEALNDYVNADSAENKHPFITQSGDTLFFVSNRKGGQGGSDIWMSIRGLEENSWTPAINMGEVINTPFNEITPYYSSAFQCLLFSSDGQVGYGGYDIFAAKGESFFEPQIYNLGFPFNSPLDDTYFVIQDSVGYLASNRNDRIHLNLYSFDVNNESLYLSLLISGESLIDSRIISRYKQVRSLDLTTFRIEDYQGFELFDPVKRDKPKPGLLDNDSEFIADNRSNNNQKLSVSNLKNSTNPEQNITSVSIKGNNSNFQTSYEKIFFSFGSVRLNNEAKISLKKLADQLIKKEGQYDNVEIHIYSDPVGSRQYNLQLSRQRGKSIINFLTDLGVDPSLLILYPEGEKNLLSQGNNWYDHFFNRRAEILVNSERPVSLSKSYKLVVRQPIPIDEAAKLLGFTSDELTKWNNFNGSLLTRGDLVRIEEPLRVTPNIRYFLDEKDIRNTFFPYIIKEGETLQSIAKKFNTLEELILEINQINTELKPGDELFIYRLNF